MSDVVLFGLGDFARVARIYLAEDSPHEVVAFTANGLAVLSRDAVRDVD